MHRYLPKTHATHPVTNLSRRRFLGNLVAGPLLLWLPLKVEAASTIHGLEGTVYVNHRPATLNTRIRAGDQIVVSHDGKLVMSMGKDAYLLRGGTVLEIARSGHLAGGLRLVTGALLAVFGKRNHSTHIVTSVATIGIRGTAVYLDSSPHRLYTCTCYGSTELRTGEHVEHISASYHSAHEISGVTANAMQMKSMAVTDHSDDELRMLESLVGRKPAFDL
jgi:hypothetical protein